MSAARNAGAFGDSQHSTGDGMDNGKRLFFANSPHGYDTMILKMGTPPFTFFVDLPFIIGVNPHRSASYFFTSAPRGSAILGLTSLVSHSIVVYLRDKDRSNSQNLPGGISGLG